MVSIALCTYNGERFLQEQLESITQQTLLPDELVVCDDGSGDRTLEILEEFKSQAPFTVHIHQNENNLGSTKNFEKAIKLCSCEIVTLCDQDDVWKPNKLARLVGALELNPDAGYVFSDAELVDENRQPMGFKLWESIGFTCKIKKKFFEGEQFDCFTQQHIVTGATMAVRANIAKIAMPFPTKGNWIHDGWIALVATSIGAFGIPIDEPLIEYRQHSNQQVGAPDEPAIQKDKSLLEMYRELKEKHRILFDDWEMRCLRVIKLNQILLQLKTLNPSPAIDNNLEFLKEFETHYINRKKILRDRHPGRYLLIVKETIAGRYVRFSDSWRSIFRDLFL
jgi:glycosyltransferase involved in cell wall biosynthesis